MDDVLSAGGTIRTQDVYSASELLFLISAAQPFERIGIRFTDMHLMTGLAEYRNGGLFVDTGVLIPRREDVRSASPTLLLQLSL